MVERINVSIIVPAHNEEELIITFLKDVTRAIRNLKINYEVIVVENGSWDETASLVLKFAKKNSKVKLVRLKEAAYGKAFKEGLKKAGGKYCVVFNVDLWDEKFLNLTKVDLLGYDIVGSSKLLKNSKDLRPFTRRAVTYFYSLFLRTFLNLKGTDTHGIKAFRVKTVQPVVKMCKTQTGIFDSELVLRSQRAGLNYLELPIEVREIRSSRFQIDRILKTPYDIWKLWRAL